VVQTISTPKNATLETHVPDGSPFPDRDERLIVWGIQRREFTVNEQTDMGDRNNFFM
jgi:hypothetical protein